MNRPVFTLVLVGLTLGCLEEPDDVNPTTTTTTLEDRTPPTWITNQPALLTQTSATAVLSLGMNENGTIYAGAFPVASGVPSNGDIVSGNGADASTALQVDAGQVASWTATNLTPDTAYALYAIGRDLNSNETNPPGEVRFSTNPEQQTDLIPPVFDAGPLLDTATADSLTLSATLSEDGMIYAVLMPDGASQPSAIQIRDDSVAGSLAFRSVAVTAATPANLMFDSLAADTPYDVFLIADDSASNLQNSPVRVDAATTT